MQGAGTLIGAVVAPMVGRRLGSARATVWLFCGVGVGALLLPWGAPGWRTGLLLAGMFLIGACVVCANVIRGAWRQSYVPLELMARTSTAVSYTHLDVYKRQVVAGGGNR